MEANFNAKKSFFEIDFSFFYAFEIFFVNVDELLYRKKYPPKNYQYQKCNICKNI